MLTWRAAGSAPPAKAAGVAAKRWPVPPPKAVGAPRVIAVGDSITEFSGPRGRGYSSFLSQCTGWSVFNYGVAGATMQAEGDLPYRGTSRFFEAAASQPDVVFLMLGTNDAKVRNWDAARYRRDAYDMVRVFLDLATRPTVFLMSPPPLFQDYEDMQPGVVDVDIPRILREVATEAGERAIFTDAVTKVFGGANRTCTGCMFEEGVLSRSGDGVHPVDYGYSQMAMALCLLSSPTCHCDFEKPSNGFLIKEVLLIGILACACVLLSVLAVFALGLYRQSRLSSSTSPTQRGHTLMGPGPGKSHHDYLPKGAGGFGVVIALRPVRR